MIRELSTMGVRWPLPAVVCFLLFGMTTTATEEALRPAFVSKQMLDVFSAYEELDTPMLQMLDAMQQLLTGEEQYNREYYSQLRECMDSLHPLLPTSQDSAWQGIITYWNMAGAPDDQWGSYNTKYFEQNATQTDFLNMTIFEPCNYASNVAYYHDVTELCAKKLQGSPFNIPNEYVDGLGKAFSVVAMGSSFMHGSHTELGHKQDAKSIVVVAYLIHQASLAGLPNASPILTDFSASPRSKTSLELADDFMNMYIELDVLEWLDHTNSLEMPGYYLIFSGIVCTVMTIAFEPEIVDEYVPILAGLFGVSDDDITFLTELYLPELRNLTGDIDLGVVEETRFVGNALSTILKLVYAFLWQEEVLTDNPLVFNETVNEMGWELLPKLNERLNNFNSFEYFELGFQNGNNIYPGDEWCNAVYPHAKWHLQSGVGLLDLVYLGNEMHRLLSSLN